MNYSGEIKKLGEWIKRETNVREVVYNKVPGSIGNGVSARLIFLSDENIESKKDRRWINLTLQLSGEAESWTNILDTMQRVQNNLLREREQNIRFTTIENPDGANVEGGDFTIELPIDIRVSTGKESLT